jgi:hypothetical protein
MECGAPGSTACCTFQAISNLDGFFPTRSASYANSFADIF